MRGEMREIMFVLLVFILIFFVKVNFLSDERSYEVKSFKVLPDTELTLLQAYEIGIEAAKKHEETPELIQLNSVDDEKVSGNDGKKANWQGIFTLPNKGQRMIFVIEKGKLKSYHIIDGSKELTIRDSEVKIDSDQIVEQAAKDFGLEARRDQFSSGFHFRILRDNRHLFLVVDGQINGKAAEIYYNPRTGAYIGRMVDSRIRSAGSVSERGRITDKERACLANEVGLVCI